MINNIQRYFISQLNHRPNFKKNLVQLIDFLFEFRKVTVGNLTRNPAYLKHLLNSKVIAKPGTLSFGAIFNPGALLIENRILLLAKAQIVPWFKTQGEKRKYYLQGNPISLSLDKNSNEILEQHILTKKIGFADVDNWAIEDTRLFYWKSQKMVNHSLLIKGEVNGVINQISVLPALSVFDEKEKTFTFCKIPTVDFPINKFEKNWVYQQKKEDLLLFYSINPFKVLKLEEEENFFFKTVINQHFVNKLNDPGGFGTLVSFSTNPIDFNERHWLLIIHQIEHKISGRCYYHWAVLINKETFLPEKITLKPIFSGMGARGRTPGIRYISSILKSGNNILFFAGEGDMYITVTKKSIKQLELLFVDL